MKSAFILYLSLIIILGCQEKKSEESKSVSDNNMSNELKYSVPKEWVAETPKSAMRKAQYRIPGIEDAADAEMAVFVFPGTGGSVQANIDRWIGQFVQIDKSDSKEKAEIKKTTLNSLPVTIVYLKGTYLQPKAPMMMGGPKEEKPNYAMLAAIVETNTDPWFFKMVGPQKTVDQWRPEFDKMVDSFK